MEQIIIEVSILPIRRETKSKDSMAETEILTLREISYLINISAEQLKINDIVTSAHCRVLGAISPTPGMWEFPSSQFNQYNNTVSISLPTLVILREKT